MLLVRARPLDAAVRLEPVVAHPAVHRRERAQLVPDLLGRRVAPVVARAGARARRGSRCRRAPRPAARAPCARAGRGARCSSRCRPPRTTTRCRGARRRPSPPSASSRCPGRRGGRARPAAAAPGSMSASDWAGFSPITYSVRSSPRSIAWNICVRCHPLLRRHRRSPRRLEPPARVLVALEVLEARELVRDRAHVSAALHVVLPAERVEARAVAPDVAAEQREVDEREHIVDGVRVLGDPERPADHRPVGAREGVRRLGDRLGRDAGQPLALRRA